MWAPVMNRGSGWLPVGTPGDEPEFHDDVGGHNRVSRVRPTVLSIKVGNPPLDQLDFSQGSGNPQAGVPERDQEIGLRSSRVG